MLIKTLKCTLNQEIKVSPFFGFLQGEVFATINQQICISLAAHANHNFYHHWQ